MARVASVEIPNNKRIEVALTYIRGIGRSLSKTILSTCQINPDIRTKDLNDEELARLRNEIEKNYQVEGELIRGTRLNIKRLQDIKSYRGIRHLKGLPVRGQRTRTNARTRKGKRAPIGGLRLKEAKK